MDNIYLIGFMGVGKSTIARLLADKLQVELVEMDETIEAETQMSIRDIFETYGEVRFRDLETALLERIACSSGAVVSCGGGVVLRQENVKKMKENGEIIFLSATPETIYDRVKNSTARPLLNGNMNVDYIRELMERRKAVYEAAADRIVVTDGKEKKRILEEILG